MVRCIYQSGKLNRRLAPRLLTVFLVSRFPGAGIAALCRFFSEFFMVPAYVWYSGFLVIKSHMSRQRTPAEWQLIDFGLQFIYFRKHGLEQPVCFVTRLGIRHLTDLLYFSSGWSNLMYFIGYCNQLFYVCFARDCEYFLARLAHRWSVWSFGVPIIKAPLHWLWSFCDKQRALSEISLSSHTYKIIHQTLRFSFADVVL